MTEFQELVKGAPKFASMERGELVAYAYATYAAGAKMEAENAELREELTAEHALAETLGHYHEIKQAENAKLRELVKITYAFLAWADGATFSDGRPAVHACDRCEVEDRMRELGVEMDQ